jgi:hypothetical protein
MPTNEGIQTVLDGMKKIATAHEFLQEVTSMRHYQKLFFKTKSKEALTKAKQHEVAVDKMLNDLNPNKW